MAMRGPVPNVTARPKPFTTAEMANMPISMPPPAQQAQQPAPAETGILPGEEQVTTRDVLRQLSPAEQSSLQKKYETGGHSQTMSYDDWLSTNFGDMPPAERAATMKSVATSAPRVSIGKDPTLPPGRNTELAKSRLAAGKPLPEGREPGQYTPEQRRTMSRNVYNPEVPMTPFGGTFTLTASGARTARAPNPEMLATADAIAHDPSQGEYSDSHIAALAQAYGIDAVQYGDDLDLLRADTLREHERHQKMAGSWDKVRNPMGGYRYAHNEAAQARERERDTASFAKTIMQRHNAYMTEDERSKVTQALNSANGFEALQDLNQLLHVRRAGYIASRVTDNARNVNMTRALNSAAQAPGMQIRSLMAAVEENNPLALAALYNYYGMPGARDAMQLEMGTRDNVADYETAQLAGNAAATPNEKTLAGQIGPELQTAMRLPQGQREMTLQILFRKAGVPEEQIQPAVQQAVLAHEATANPEGELVQSKLRSLANNETAFKDFARNLMRLDDTQAHGLWEKFSGKSVDAARQAGQQSAQEWKDWGARTGAWMGGFFGSR